MEQAALYGGIDISKQEPVSQFIDNRGNSTHPVLRVMNNHQGAVELISTIKAQVAEINASNIHIGMEATNIYWYHIFGLIRQELTNLAPQVYLLNPALVKGFKRLYTSLPKTDAIARVIADRVRFGRVEPSPAVDLQYDALRRITRFRFSLAGSWFFSSLLTTTMKLLLGPLVSHLCLCWNTSVPNSWQKQMRLIFLADHSNNRLGGTLTAEEIAKELKHAARLCYRLHPEMEDAADTVLAMTFDNIRFMQQLKRVDKVIKRELAAFPQTLTTIPGIGYVLAAGMVAEIGDISKHHGQAALAKAAGLTWTRHQSGSFDAEETSMTKSGNKYLRWYLVEAADKVRMHTPEYRAFYQRKLRDVSKHRHKRALVLTARKLIRLVFALLSKGQIYRAKGGR